MLDHEYEPNRFVWGTDCADGLEELVAAEDATRAMVVCGEHVGGNERLMTAVESGLGSAHVHTYTGVRSHTPLETVERGVDALRSHDADALVSVGGGAASDTAKAIAVLHAEDGRTIHDLKAQTDEDGELDLPELPAPKVPLFAVATTLSAAEVSNAFGVKDEGAGEKAGIIDERVRPKACLYDPALLETTPKDVLASTGMNALDHAVEVLYSDSRGENPFYQATAEKAIGLLLDNLPAAVAPDADRDALQDVALGAALSALGLVGGICINHGINHALCAKFPVAHGDGNSILLPHGVAYNHPVVPERVARIADAMDVPVDDPEDEAVVDGIRAKVGDLQDEIGVPKRLRDVDVPNDESAFREMAAVAAKDFAMASNPRPVSAADVERVLGEAW